MRQRSPERVTAGCHLGHEVGGIRLRLARPVNQEVDLGGGKARDLEVEREVDCGELAELEPQDLLVPARPLGDPVVGDDVGALLLRGEVLDANGRDLGVAEDLRGRDAAVAGDDLTVPVDQDGVGEAELFDRGGDLVDLPLGVGAGVAGVGLERSESAGLDLQVTQERCR
jgi:hypothetical protein